MGSGKAAILLNHGLLTVGSTVDEASFLFGLLDRSCEIRPEGGGRLCRQPRCSSK